jgi:hypothetical protein
MLYILVYWYALQSPAAILTITTTTTTKLMLHDHNSDKLKLQDNRAPGHGSESVGPKELTLERGD